MKHLSLPCLSHSPDLAVEIPAAQQPCSPASQEDRRTCRPGSFPSGPVFCSGYWAGPCLPYKQVSELWFQQLWPQPCDKVFLSDVHVTFCHKKVQHTNLLRNMHQVYFLTSKWMNFSGSIGNERKITWLWSYPKIWFLWSSSCNLTTTSQSSENSRVSS